MAIDAPLVMRRVAAGVAVLVVVPLLVMLSTLNEEAPLAVGQVASRTVVSDRPISIEDVAETQRLRDQARASVEQQFVQDQQAERETIADITSMFGLVLAARAPVEVEVEVPPPPTAPGEEPQQPTTRIEERVPSTEEQLDTLRDQIPFLDDDALTRLIELSDEQLASVQENVLEIARQLLRGGIREDELQEVLARELPTELNTRSWPGPEAGFASEVAAPIVREYLRPTLVLDAEATRELQDEAEEAIEPQFRTWNDGDVIVAAGDEVDAVEFQALELLGEAGSEPGVAFVRALLAMLLVLAVFALYLQRSQDAIWHDPPRLYVLSVTMVVAATLLFVVELLVGAFGIAWWFAFPIGGLALLVAVLTNPRVGLASVLPLATLALLFAPSVPALAILVTAAVLFAAPTIERVSTRVGLRRASVRVAVVTPLLALVVAVVFGPREQTQLLIVVVAATVAGLANVGLLQGLLPAFESGFKLATVTALLDLADRNHPLLRELESKAMGSYNHSVMVANLAERCCREIGANHLLGQVAGLYHDIGKVRQPLFFIENQRGIANPHDQLTPRMSAVIIQNHVTDGVEMATEHRLPPDVVDCIASHHGTMRVTYFWKLAIDAKGGDPSLVDEDHFRYKGHKPRSKEAAVLLLADCTEAATRAMAMDRGTLPTDLIESTVDRLARERLEDGQFEDCQLTFTEFQTVRDTLVEALTGIYHPRIGYPAGTGGSQR